MTQVQAFMIILDSIDWSTSNTRPDTEIRSPVASH
jgi:hypothetical protein